MEMKNTFVELEQFEELTPEVLEEVKGGGIFVRYRKMVR